MSKQSNLEKLKTSGIEIKGTLQQNLKARHIEWLTFQLNDELAKETLQILLKDRNARAEINIRQNQDITRHAGTISQLTKENTFLNKRIDYWKAKADYFKERLETLHELFELKLND